MDFRSLDRQQQVSWALSLGVATILLFILLSPLWAQYVKYRDAAELNANTLGTLQYLQNSRASLEAGFEEYQRAGLREWLYASTNNEAQISLAIQKQVTEEIADSGASLVSASILKSTAGKAYLEPGVRLDFQGDMPAIMQILQQLDAARPVLVVDNLLMRPQNDRRRMSQTSSQTLSVQFEVRAYIPLPGEAP